MGPDGKPDHDAFIKNLQKYAVDHELEYRSEFISLYANKGLGGVYAAGRFKLGMSDKGGLFLDWQSCQADASESGHFKPDRGSALSRIKKLAAQVDGLKPLA